MTGKEKVLALWCGCNAASVHPDQERFEKNTGPLVELIAAKTLDVKRSRVMFLSIML